MSWELAVFAVLASTLVLGVLWYERSRPASQVIALVAALAALAAAGRVALSPIPNVVPTTDIALLSGYALGGAPGFAIGSLAALVSNFWLGQGPWTPWQMAGWGMTGALGAALAALGGRGLGRLPLAVACALAGLAYGALLDLSLMVTYGGEQSLERFGALSARGLPFNIAHAAGNFALALVAGPALVRMLRRYRGRFEFAWSPRRRTRRAAAVGAAALLAASVASGVPAQEPAAAAPNASEPAPATAAAKRGKGIAAAVAWLRGAQNRDGGFGAAPGDDSTPGITGWAVLGLEAAGVNPEDVRGGKSPLAYLAARKREVSGTGDLQRTILVLVGAGRNPARFGGRDLVAALRNRREADGSWDGQVNPTAFGILALEGAGRSKGNNGSAAWLRSVQNDDGGWGFAPAAASDADSTGAALQALAAAGGGEAAIRDGVAWLRRAQGSGGGFALAGGPVNAQSTAWAAQGLIAAGVSPGSVRSGGGSPLDYLASVQARDGHYRYSDQTDQTPVWVTGQALAALSGKAFPLAAVPQTRAKAGGAAAAPPAPAPPTGAAPAPAAPAPKAKPPAAAPAPAPAPAPETPATPPNLEPVEQAAEEDGSEDDSSLPEIAAAALAVFVAGGGVWMLRRQRPG